MNNPISTEWEYRLVETRRGSIRTGSGFVMVKDGDGNSYTWAAEASHPIHMGYFAVTGWGHTPEDALASAKRQAYEAERTEMALQTTGAAHECH
jgi:hypothetical protein